MKISLSELSVMYERQLAEKDFAAMHDTLCHIKKYHSNSPKGVLLFKKIEEDLISVRYYHTR